MEGAREILAAGPAFVLERWQRGCSGSIAAEPGRPVWLVPVAGGGTIDGQALEPGSAWLVEGEVDVALEQGADMLVSYAGKTVRSFDAIRFESAVVPIQRRRFRDALLRKAS
jgi:mannose-6-phosphate isomerase